MVLIVVGALVPLLLQAALVRRLLLGCPPAVNVRTLVVALLTQGCAQVGQAGVAVQQQNLCRPLREAAAGCD